MRLDEPGNLGTTARGYGRLRTQIIALFGFIFILSLTPVLASDCLNWYEGHYFYTALAADVEECVKWGADPEASDDMGRTSLHRAARFSPDARVIRALAAAGADPNTADANGLTPLHFAALLRSGTPVIAATLVEVGANPNARDENGWTPLHIAAEYNSRHYLILELTRLGADANARTSSDGTTPLHHAAAHNGAPEVIAALAKSGADLNARDWNGWTALHHAAGNNSRADVIGELIKLGADANARISRNGTMPLHHAAAANEAAVITALADAGADLKARDWNGWTALHHAARNNSRADVITELAGLGADPNASDGEGWTPLYHAAAFNEEAEVIAALVRAGAEVGARDKAGRTALHYAARYSATGSAVSELAFLGADPDARDEQGQAPLHHAAQFNEHPDIVAAFVADEVGADPNARDVVGKTPLHIAAASSGNPDIITALAAFGGDPDLPDEAGMLALHYVARVSDNPEAILALLKAGADPFAISYLPMGPARRANVSSLALANMFNVNTPMSELMLKLHMHGPRRWRMPLENGLHRAVCWFDVHESWPRKQCYFMVVNEDPKDAESSLIAFPVVRYFALEDGGKNPILHLGGGGPGSSIGLEFGDPGGIWESYKTLRGGSGRDLYVMDPRGVGMPHPRLHCPETLGPKAVPATLAKPATAREEGLQWRSSFRTCKERLDRQGHDLSHYNSRNVARDVESLRRALNVERWVLYGVSYGSRYALTIARDYPDTVEAMVLNGAVFPNVRGTDLYARQLNAVFEKAFDWCDSAGLCEASELRKHFWELVGSLNESPLVVDTLPQHLVEVYNVNKFVLTGPRLVDAVFSALYDAEFFPELHVLVYELRRGSSRLLVKVLGDYLGTYLDATHSDPVSFSHYCAEEFPFADYETGVRNARAFSDHVRDLTVGYVLDMQYACGLWGVAPADPIEGAAIETGVPTLFLQGALDPATPIDYLYDQLKYFSRHAVRVFEDSSHWGSVEGDCAMATAAYFIEHKQLDDSGAFICDP